MVFRTGDQGVHCTWRWVHFGPFRKPQDRTCQENLTLQVGGSHYLEVFFAAAFKIGPKNTKAGFKPFCERHGRQQWWRWLGRTESANWLAGLGCENTVAATFCVVVTTHLFKKWWPQDLLEPRKAPLISKIETPVVLRAEEPKVRLANDSDADAKIVSALWCVLRSASRVSRDEVL